MEECMFAYFSRFIFWWPNDGFKKTKHLALLL